MVVRIRTFTGRWPSVVLTHGLLTTLLTWPALIHVHSHSFGHLRGDRLMYLWDFWWVRYALLELHQAPLHTPMQYHPGGVSLALHDMTWFWSLASVPLQALFELQAILNGFMLLSFVLNGLAFYQLAREVTGSHGGALAGSVVYAHCPYFLSRLQVAHVSLLGAFFLPLFLLMLWRYARRPGPGPLLVAGLLLAGATLCHYYYGVMLALVLAAFLPVQAFLARKQPDVPKLPARMLHLAGLVAVAGLILAPVVVPILLQLQRGDYPRPATPQSYEYLEASSADLASYFVPDFSLVPWRGYGMQAGDARHVEKVTRSLHGNVTEKAVYPGWVSWLALAAVLGSRSLRRRFWPWALLAAVALVCSLGPTLYVQGHATLNGMLPLRFLHEIPVLNLIRGPSRFAVGVTLGTGMLVAAVLALVAERRGPRVARFAVLAALVLTCAEFLPEPTALHPRRSFLSPFYRTLRAEPGRYGILNVPVDFRGARGGGDLHLLAQTVHQKPIVGGYVAREPEAVFATRDGSTFLRAVEQRQYERDWRLRLGEEGLADMKPTLERLNLRYVIAHRPMLPPGEWERVLQWLERGLGRPVYEDEWIRAYRYERSE